MTYHGVPKPGWRGFQLLNDAGSHRVPTTLGNGSSDLAVQERYVQQIRQQGSGQQCVTEAGTDMAGFTLSTHPEITSAAKCCAGCQSADQSHCSFWTFTGKECIFKSSDAGREAKPGYTSGSRLAPGPNGGEVGSPLSAFATVNTTAGRVDSLQVYMSLWANPKDPDAVANRTVTVTIKHKVGAHTDREGQPQRARSSRFCDIKRF
jgi:hypothetical protein